MEGRGEADSRPFRVTGPPPRFSAPRHPHDSPRRADATGHQGQMRVGAWGVRQEASPRRAPAPPHSVPLRRPGTPAVAPGKEACDGDIGTRAWLPTADDSWPKAAASRDRRSRKAHLLRDARCVGGAAQTRGALRRLPGRGDRGAHGKAVWAEATPVSAEVVRTGDQGGWALRHDFPQRLGA